MSAGIGSWARNGLDGAAAFARLPRPLRSRWALVGARVLGTVALAGFAIAYPEISGPYRYWFAGVLLAVVVPANVVIERLGHPPASANAMFDLVATVVLVHFVPEAWHTALVIGVILAVAPQIAGTRRAYRRAIGMSALLVAGMSFAGVVHDVPNWTLSILAFLAMVPTLFLYSWWESEQNEQMRRRSERVEGLTLLAGGVAHDFNNILTGIVGQAEVVRLALEPGHAARPAVDAILAGGNRAALLSAQLVAFSGREVPARIEIDLGREVRGLAKLLESVVPKGVSIECEAPESLPTVLGDRAQLQQVLMNLILNAAEAPERAPARVQIRVRAEPPSNGDRGHVICEVQDEGPGITDLERIFDPYYTTKPNGNGLGLVSVRRILSEHGGTIDFGESEGPGTTVAVRLPVHGLRPAVTEAVEPAFAPAPGRALVIDDEPMVRQAIGRMLEVMGYSVAFARDGADGLAQLRSAGEDVGLVVLDLKMPGMDGWECLRGIREQAPDLPVVISSGFDPRRTPDGAELDARTGFLPKPFRLAELRAAIDALAADDEAR